MESKRDISESLGSEIVIYQTEDGHTKIDVKFEDETVWLTQAQLCELYQTSKSNISEHIKHIFEEGELDETSVVRKFRTTASDGKILYNTFRQKTKPPNWAALLQNLEPYFRLKKAFMPGY